MMSISAIANGGGVAAGSLVATLQSVGKCPLGGLLVGLREKDRSLGASGPDLQPQRELVFLFLGISSLVPLSLSGFLLKQI